MLSSLLHVYSTVLYMYEYPTVFFSLYIYYFLTAFFVDSLFLLLFLDSNSCFFLHFPRFPRTCFSAISLTLAPALFFLSPQPHSRGKTRGGRRLLTTIYCTSLKTWPTSWQSHSFSTCQSTRERKRKLRTPLNALLITFVIVYMNYSLLPSLLFT